MTRAIVPTFRVMPESVPERWGLIRRFVQNWTGVSLIVESDLEAPPLPPNEVAPGYPRSFIEWFRFCRALETAECNCFEGDNLVTEVIPGQNAVSLMLRGEGDCYWGVLYSDLRSDDPPVHKFVVREDSPTDVFSDVGAVSESVAEFALLQLAFRIFPRSWIPAAPATDERIQRMKSEFDSHARLGRLWIFESPSVAVIVRGDGTMIVGTEKCRPDCRLPVSVSEVAW